MLIGVVGHGTVGQALHKFLSILGHSVKVYDPAKGFRDDLKGCETCFICVNADTLPNGKVDLGNIHAAIESCPVDKPIIIKSTIPVGKTDRIREQYMQPIYFSPEFLQARKPMDNMLKLPVLIDEECPTGLAMEIFKDHQVRFYPVKVLEALKYFTNTFFAMKVTFANIWFEQCQQKQINYHDLYDALYDLVGDGGSISMEGLQVPGPDMRFGFGGACLPKDLASWLHQSPHFLFHMIYHENQRLRQKPSR